jgi:hypothetical protein
MLNSLDMFCAKAVASWKKEMEELEAKYKHWKKAGETYMMAAERILERKGRLTLETHPKFMREEILMLLRWQLGKMTGKKQDLIKRYCETPAPSAVVMQLFTTQIHK